MRYDNDCNANIVKNGELYLIKFLSRSNFFNKTESLSCKEKEYFFDIGANEGQYTKILHFYFIKNSSKEIKKKKRERERERDNRL
jgi:hypothetical protein